MTAQHTLPHLRRGAGKSDGSDGLCAMQVISWENGDTKITDTPACADPVLTRIVQVINDRICTHRSGRQLCPPCSIAVLGLAHRTVGTAGTDDVERRRVWVRIAVDQARQLLHRIEDPATERRAAAAVAAAERWVAAAERWVGAADAANAYAAANAAIYANNANNAAAATPTADDCYICNAAAYAATAAACGPRAGTHNMVEYVASVTRNIINAGGDTVSLGHNAVDLFEQLTGRTPQPATPGTTATHTVMTNIGGLPS